MATETLKQKYDEWVKKINSALALHYSVNFFAVSMQQNDLK